MGIYKSYVAAGLYFMEHREAGLDAWSQMMVRDYGKAVTDDLREIRQWSLLYSMVRAGARPDRRNCWEFTGCGKEAHGLHAKEMGICPAALESRLDGMHGGKNGGRACWVVGGTLCGGQAPPSFAQKRKTCEDCAFYRAVKDEEGDCFILNDEMLFRFMR
jgi:hypothetical protein